jgi:hypothetical protein
MVTFKIPYTHARKNVREKMPDGKTTASFFLAACAVFHIYPVTLS